jgi:hypothetical protein
VTGTYVVNRRYACGTVPWANIPIPRLFAMNGNLFDLLTIGRELDNHSHVIANGPSSQIERSVNDPDRLVGAVIVPQ